MTDRITLSGLRVRGNHGVFAHEKRDGQDFLVDVVAWLDLDRAAASDDVGDTLHYGELAQHVAAIVGGEPCDLIETVATKVAEEIMTDSRLHATEVTIHKPHAPIPLDFVDVAVTIRRSRRGGGRTGTGTAGTAADREPQ